MSVMDKYNIEENQLFKDFVKQYNGWFIPETKADIEEVWILFNNSVYKTATFDSKWTPEENCDHYLTDRKTFDNILEKKMLLAMLRYEEGTIVLAYKYSNGIDMYRLLGWGLDNDLWLKVFVDNYMTHPVLMPFYKELMKFTGKQCYCTVGSRTPEENKVMGEAWNMTGYFDENIDGWVWNV